MAEDIASTSEYNELLESIKETLTAARLRAARAVTNVLVETYWRIGHEIRRRQEEQGWGAQVIDRLAVDLRLAQPDSRGLSRRNLQYMAAMAARWPDPIVQQPVAQLPWGHVVGLLDKCPDAATSDFYAARAAEEGWTRDTLHVMITSCLHERVTPALTTFEHAIPEQADRERLQQIIKDPYVLDFLANGRLHERELRQALTDNLVRLLRELGAGFAFVGAEVPIMCGTNEYFIDLLFYHYRMHRFVVFELKVEPFKPEHVGKLNFYVQLVDEQLRDPERHEPTVGILLVVGRDEVTVEVGLRGIATPIAVSEWRRLPPEVRQALPSASDLTRVITNTIHEVGTASVA